MKKRIISLALSAAMLFAGLSISAFAEEPLTEAEVAKMGVETTVDLEVEYKVGDTVEITAGPMEGSVGTVDEIDIPARKVRVRITMFGRELPAELELHQVKLF